MNFSHCGKMGDMFQCLPILSYIYKTKGIKSNLFLAKFPFVEETIEILKLQECIKSVHIIDYTPDNFACGGQPYKFPSSIPNLIQLGFRYFPDKFYTEFMAEEYDLGVDYDFVLNLGDVIYPEEHCIIFDEVNNRPLMDHIPYGHFISTDIPLLTNIRRAKSAERVITFTTGSAVLLTLARITCEIYCYKGLKELHMDKIYQLHGGYTIKEI